MSEKLKPCPFCGGEAVYSKKDTSETVPFGTMQHFVTCKNNCLEGLYARGNTKEEAIKAWNHRPSHWNTGTPTEEGWYLCQTKGRKGSYLPSVLRWNGEIWTSKSKRPLVLMDVVAWQKIEEKT